LSASHGTSRCAKGHKQEQRTAMRYFITNHNPVIGEISRYSYSKSLLMRRELEGLSVKSKIHSERKEIWRKSRIPSGDIIVY
jgi:hypothetical protein